MITTVCNPKNGKFYKATTFAEVCKITLGFVDGLPLAELPAELPVERPATPLAGSSHEPEPNLAQISTPTEGQVKPGCSRDPSGQQWLIPDDSPDPREDYHRIQAGYGRLVPGKRRIPN